MSGFQWTGLKLVATHRARPPFTGSVQELLVDSHVAVFVGKVVHVMADALAIERAVSPRRMSRFNAVEIFPTSIGSSPQRLRAFTAIARVRRSTAGSAFISASETWRTQHRSWIRSGATGERRRNPVSVGVAHAGDFVISEIEFRVRCFRPSFARYSGYVQSLLSPRHRTPGSRGALGREMSSR